MKFFYGSNLSQFGYKLTVQIAATLLPWSECLNQGYAYSHSQSQAGRATMSKLGSGFLNLEEKEGLASFVGLIKLRSTWNTSRVLKIQSVSWCHSLLWHLDWWGHSWTRAIFLWEERSAWHLARCKNRSHSTLKCTRTLHLTCNATNDEAAESTVWPLPLFSFPALLKKKGTSVCFCNSSCFGVNWICVLKNGTAGIDWFHVDRIFKLGRWIPTDKLANSKDWSDLSVRVFYFRMTALRFIF